jgi:uncharacterized surface protein with fasciclin (FAS1) repeats
MKKFVLTACLALFAANTILATEQPCSKSATATPEKKDIVDTAVGAKKFGTLVAAVKAAGLVETLKSKGPFTVFAPLDSAFAKLPEGTVKDLLKPENKKKLAAILTYHVVPGKVMAKAAIKVAKKGGSVKTVQGSKIKLSLKEGSVYINGAKVVKTDIACSNGVIHVLDSVILPPSDD